MIKLVGVLTIIAGLPGLGGLLLFGKLGDFPFAATVVVINSFLLRGVCGTLGGILIWRGNRWGYYLSSIAWVYLVAVSVLTLSDLYGRGLALSPGFLQDNYSAFGRPFAWSLIKILFGLPIIYIIFKGLPRNREFGGPPE